MYDLIEASFGDDLADSLVNLVFVGYVDVDDFNLDFRPLGDRAKLRAFRFRENAGEDAPTAPSQTERCR